jgi:hypothetical protein
MLNYAEMPTAELLELLFKEEDRVAAAHIQAVAQRPEALTRLREIWQNEDYWYEGDKGDFWIVYHALTALALNASPADMPVVLSQFMTPFYADNQWVIGILPAALAAFGEPMVAPLMDFILKERGGYKDNNDYSQARYKAAATLARIAQQQPALREPVFNFLSKLFTDAQEDDTFFLSFAADSMVYLERRRGLQALRAAYDRKAVSKEMIGSYSQFVASLDNPEHHHQHDFEVELLDFYQPELIAERQKRWKQEAEEPETLYWEPGAPPPASAPPAWRLDEDIEAPVGYEVSETGSIISMGKVGRNDPCPCGSGKKYKKCCGANA